MVPHPNGTPGLYLGGMTVTGLAAAMGGMGAFDVVAFTYDRNTNTATLNANAAVFNTTGSEFALNWGRDGLYAVADRPTGVFQATTATAGGVLTGATAIPGIGATYVDPCPGTIGGTRVLFYDNPAGGLAYRTHDVTMSMLTGTAVLVTGTPTGGNIAHSPWPMVGGDGDVEGLIGAQADSTFSFSDWNWQGDLNPTTAPITQQATAADFENNGCEAGGRVYMPQNSSAGYRVLESNVVGLLGDSVKTTGGTLDLTAFSPTKSVGTPDITVMAIGVSFLATPLTIPGIGNTFGLDAAAGIVILGFATHSNTTGRGTLTFPTPPLAAGTIPVQGVTVIGGGAAHLTSTTVISIVP
jgi:hypothetical protein